MHAVVVMVRIAPGQFDSARKSLHDEVVPRVSKAPGFVKGYWMISADSTQGTSFIVFDNKQHAEAAMQMVRSTPTPPGVTIGTVDVREVVAEA